MAGYAQNVVNDPQATLAASEGPLKNAAGRPFPAPVKVENPAARGRWSSHMTSCDSALCRCRLFDNSDVRLKEDVQRIGTTVFGLPLYHFKCIGAPEIYKGVMAHEVLQVMPDAVLRGEDGYYRVNYHALGTSMRRVGRGEKRLCPVSVAPQAAFGECSRPRIMAWGKHCVE